LGRYTKKNKRKYLAWQEVELILSDATAGMTTAELFEMARKDLHKLNIVTFRSYLREFCSSDRRLLERRSGRWLLTLGVRELMPSEKKIDQ
jgi:hypothetical protein